MTDEFTQPEKAVPAAWKQIDKGKVVACADAEFLWNGNQEMGIDVGNNREFAQRILGWLAKKNVPKRKVFESAIEQKKLIQGRVLFVLWHNGRGLEHTQSGLYQLAMSFPAPLNSIAEQLGVTFPAYTFMAPGKNHFRAKAAWGKDKITISRAGVVQPLAKNKLKVLAKGEKGTWSELAT